jgi:hypothetical protein
MAFDASTIKKVIRSLSKPALGVLRYALTLGLFCGIWWYDARVLNQAFDLNLTLLKGATAVFDGSGKAEAMMRAFAAEKMLLFAEGSAIIWAVGSIAVGGFRWFFSAKGRDSDANRRRSSRMNDVRRRSDDE